MRGSIRAFLGFLIVYGAVGSLDYDPTASVFEMSVLAVVGLVIMASGVFAMKGQYE
jgi:Co/Zn/Cd efflux system component